MNDWMGRDIEKMARNNRFLETHSVQELQDAMNMSIALNAASNESPQATVMTAVRAIEHVNAWTTRGVKNWVDFVSAYFKKAQARVRVVEFMSYFTRNPSTTCQTGGLARRSNLSRNSSRSVPGWTSSSGPMECSTCAVVPMRSSPSTESIATIGLSGISLNSKGCSHHQHRCTPSSTSNAAASIVISGA